MAYDVRFRILGSLGVSVDDTPIEIGAPRQRALLALLLLDANRWLRPDVLIEGIWGDAIPQHPDAALQIVVSRLRNTLGPAADRIASGANGYRIVVADDELDHLLARRHFLRAQELSTQNDFEGAAAVADVALQCWTGDAMTDLADAHLPDAAYRELRELRFAVFELRTRAYLRCGRHVEILADIDSWVGLEPWRERTRQYHMIALYRAGRRVDALTVYEDLRTCLAEEFGVEPSTFVKELETRIREQDPALLARRAGIVVPLPAWTTSGLPFVGRTDEESRIFNRLREVAAGATRMVLVEGEAGIGKSRLVLEAARRAHDEAIVLAVDGADALRPGLHTIAAALAAAASRLSDPELRLCLGRWPGDLAEMIPSLRRRLPDLPPPLDADDATRAARRRAAVISGISSLSQRAPVLLMLDDLHRAGPTLLMLLWALLADEEPKRVLVLATARSGAADRSSRLEQLAHRLEQRGTLDRIELEGLAPAAVGRLVSELERADAPTLAAQLTLSTRGHPYLLGEMLREPDAPAAEAINADVAVRARHYVLRRVAALGEPGARLLDVAAAVDGEFDIALLGELSHGTPESTTVLVDRAIDAGLLHVTGLGSFDFVHDLARRAIAESIDAEARSELHRTVATVLEMRDSDPARIALQWDRVTGSEGDLGTVVWAERAGEAALLHLDPHAAVEWFRLAVDRAVEERTRAHLLIRLAGAQCRAGDRAGPDTLRAALEIARRLDDAELLVENATLWSPIWASMPTLSPAERIAVLSESSSRVHDVGVRAQLLARLATELMNTPEWKRAHLLAEEAMSSARASDSRAVLPEVCMRHFQTTGAPHSLEARRDYMHDVLLLTANDRDPIQRFFALSMAASAAIEGADVAQADDYLDTAFEIARETDVPVLAYNTECIRVWRTGLTGNLGEAERLAFAAMRLGARNGIDFAVVGPGMQVGNLRWQLGRFAELLPLLRVTATEDDIGASILLARALACTNETNAEAREVVRKAASHEFDDLPRGLHWAGCLIAAAEVAYLLDDVALGRLVRDLLEPFADGVAFNGSWAIAPIAYGAAVAGAATGERTADELFEHAIGVCRRLEAPLLRARTEMAWSRVLTARDDAPTKALALVSDARETFTEHRLETFADSADAFASR